MYDAATGPRPNPTSSNDIQRTRRIRAGATLTAIVMAAGISTAGCDTLEDAARGGDDPFDLKVGECLGETGAGQVEAVNIVSCDEPHETEVFAVGDLWKDTLAFPGPAGLEEEAAPYCEQHFATYVGTPWEDSELDFTYLAPTLDGWNELGDREVVCMLLDPAGPLTGSQKDAGI